MIFEEISVYEVYIKKFQLYYEDFFFLQLCVCVCVCMCVIIYYFNNSFKVSKYYMQLL